MEIIILIILMGFFTYLGLLNSEFNQKDGKNGRS